jgi:hypothetical protein
MTQPVSPSSVDPSGACGLKVGTSLNLEKLLDLRHLALLFEAKTAVGLHSVSYSECRDLRWRGSYYVYTNSSQRDAGDSDEKSL